MKICKSALAIVLSLLCVFSVFTMVPHQNAEAAAPKLTIEWTAKANAGKYNVSGTPVAPLEVNFKISGANKSDVYSVQVTVWNKYEKFTTTYSKKNSTLKLQGKATFNTKYFNTSYNITVVAKNKSGKAISATITPTTKSRYNSVKTTKFKLDNSRLRITKVATENGRLYVHYKCYAPGCDVSPSVYVVNTSNNTTYGYTEKNKNVLKTKFYLKKKASGGFNGSAKPKGYVLYTGKQEIDYNTKDTIYVNLIFGYGGTTKTLKSLPRNI